MKSYVKLYGPSISEALVALRKVAVDFPEVCVMDAAIETVLEIPSGAGILDTMRGVQTFFGGAGAISEERCDTIISKSGESLGANDFFYEWFQKPSVAQVEELISKIDKALAPTGARYTLTTK